MGSTKSKCLILFKKLKNCLMLKFSNIGAIQTQFLARYCYNLFL